MGLRKSKRPWSRGVMSDVYASGDLQRDEYVKLCLTYDNEINKLKASRAEVVSRIPLLHKANVVHVAITQFCSAAEIRFLGYARQPSATHVFE
jgi:hypothetical protein